MCELFRGWSMQFLESCFGTLKFITIKSAVALTKQSSVHLRRAVSSRVDLFVRECEATHEVRQTQPSSFPPNAPYVAILAVDDKSATDIAMKLLTARTRSWVFR